jgi:hypothetical protein
VGETPPLVIQIAPPNSDTGTLDLITVSRGAALNPVTPVLLTVPDDFAPFVKWGALADLLSKDGLAADPARALHCEKRWQQGIQIAKTASMVWSARVQNVPIQISALTEADLYDPGWQARSGQPDTMLLTGGGIIALSDVPDSGPYAITVDVVRNAPIPATLSDYLQVGSEVLDSILDYAEALALFKEGYAAVQESEPLLDRFMRAAGVSVSLDLAKTPNLGSLTDQSLQDEKQTPRMAGA